ncbi:TPA: helix-turn-helix domain-containing protein [Yersinia enterocolitica]
MKTPGQRIKHRRLELKLTQKELAKRVGVAHVTISQWERDDTSPRGDRLFLLAEGLKCDPSWVLRGDLAHNPPQEEALLKSEQLTAKESVLLELFSSLPKSEQEQLIKTLEEKKQHYDQLLEELLNTKSRNKA